MSGPQTLTPYDVFSLPGRASLLIATNAAELIAHIATLNAATGGTILCLPGSYDLPAGAGPTISQTINIVGPGAQAGVIQFSPTAHDQSAFTFDAGGTNTINYCSISGFAFSSTDTTYRKIGITLIDAWGMRIFNVAIRDGEWTDGALLSEFLRSKGRHRLHFYESTVDPDIPIHIMANPHAGVPTADHYYLGPSLELTPAVGNAAIKVDANVGLSNLTLDGVALVRGGFVWAGTNVTATIHIRFANIRCEQFAAGQWCFDISGTNLVQALTFDNVRLSPTGKGIRARNVTQLNLTQVFDGGSVTALDIDGTVYNTKGDNVRVGGATTVSLTNQKLVRAGSRSEEVSALPSPFFEYQSTLSANAITVSQLGYTKLTFYGNGLANGGTVQLADTFDGTEKSVEFRVFARNASTGAALGGVVYATGGASGTATCPASSAAFDAGNVAGKLTIFWQAQANIILYNQLGVAVDYAIEMTVYK